jgi:manganese/iron transport system permease protein
MMLVAVLAATVSCLIGTLLSFHLDAATGPMIVVVQASLFTVLVITRQVRIALA